jgi:hypothetical protein
MVNQGFVEVDPGLDVVIGGAGKSRGHAVSGEGPQAELALAAERAKDLELDPSKGQVVHQYRAGTRGPLPAS